MKRVILFLVFATLLSNGIKAQDSAKAEQIDIRALVAKQISDAQKNMRNLQENDGKRRTKEAASEIPNAVQVNEEKSSGTLDGKIIGEIIAFFEKTKNNIWTKLTNLSSSKRKMLPYFLSVEVTLLGIILAVFYLSRKSGSSKKIKNLKDAVRKMREEKLGSFANPEKSKLRSGLTVAPIRIDDGGREIVKFAKKSGISKGEVILAVKVRRLASMHK